MKTLVCVFSAKGHTKAMAEELCKEKGFDFFGITPVEPYSKADILWENPFSRCNREYAKKLDVAVSGKVENFDEYERVMIGFPIWYGCAPNVVNTFCKGYDFIGKKVIAFATSGGSPIGKTAEKLAPYLTNCTDLDAVLVKNLDDLKKLVD